MDTIGPVLLCCVGPLIFGGFMFLVGRYSMTHTIQLPSVKRRQAAAVESPFYQNFEEQ